MHPLEKKVKKILGRQQLLVPGDRVLVAVSAGPDSMALLHLLARLAGPGDFSIIAAYVNHGLRPVEAAQEEELVGRRAAVLDIPWVIGRVAVREHAENKGLSLEHAARDLRYAFLDKTAAREQADKIGLAHTADDQAEELLIRLIRGTGRAGLAGMKTIRAGRYIRPLLAIPKDELLRYLHDREIPWLRDSSNQDRSLLRNRVRQELLPFLAQRFNPNIRETLLRTATILQDEEALLAELCATAAAGIFSQSTDRQASEKDSAPPPLTLNLDRLRQQPRALQRRLLETACWLMDTRPDFRVIAQLLELIDTRRPAAGLHLANGLRARREGNILLFSFPRGQGRLRGDLGG
ncbi:MAG: tRNA lysidine(34) synthetase TilS [Desulfobacterales bacterium]|nr:tRNA lysidine(34) synthetase TilS [Desulfobacterales bacterium]